jgi:hypothetical protein
MFRKLFSSHLNQLLDTSKSFIGVNDLTNIGAQKQTISVVNQAKEKVT